ncbi:MAG: polysaccharide deacetylase family protein, partial [Candidatus Fimadaptatus sp.]|nr:polysaccharide deacetylase family protein [Candidatus Fimadaptatus sp.]
YSNRPGRKPRRRANPRAALDRLSGIAGRIARHAAPRDDTRPAYYTDPRKDASGAEESVVYGGRDHDNIPSADMRPNIGKKPLIGLCALFVVLLVAVPLMMRGVTRVNLYDDKSVRPAAAISLQSQTAATAAPTDQPSQQPTAEPTISPGMMVSQYTGRTLDKTKPAVALTFDDGPSNQTGRILDALEKDGGLATFFLVGDRVEKYAETAQREYASGCLVGTHMYSHTKLTDMTAAEVENELNQCSAIHLSVIGAQPSVARPPYGSTNATVREAVNLPLINWSLNSNDWETRDADRIYNDVMNNIQDGDIVLFHDLKDFSASAIERIVPALTKQGYQLVTVQELFELKGRTLEPGVVYSSRVTAEQ